MNYNTSSNYAKKLFYSFHKTKFNTRAVNIIIYESYAIVVINFGQSSVLNIISSIILIKYEVRKIIKIL